MILYQVFVLIVTAPNVVVTPITLTTVHETWLKVSIENHKHWLYCDDPNPRITEVLLVGIDFALNQKLIEKLATPTGENAVKFSNSWKVGVKPAVFTKLPAFIPIYGPGT